MTEPNADRMIREAADSSSVFVGTAVPMFLNDAYQLSITVLEVPTITKYKTNWQLLTSSTKWTRDRK